MMNIINSFLKQSRRDNTHEVQVTPHKRRRSAVWGLRQHPERQNARSANNPTQSGAAVWGKEERGKKRINMDNEQKFCQSCGMPLTNEILGSNADGTKNEEYCIYCYKDGADAEIVVFTRR